MHLGAALLKACTMVAIPMNDFKIHVFYNRKYKCNMDQTLPCSCDALIFNPALHSNKQNNVPDIVMVISQEEKNA